MYQALGWAVRRSKSSLREHLGRRMPLRYCLPSRWWLQGRLFRYFLGSSRSAASIEPSEERRHWCIGDYSILPSRGALCQHRRRERCRTAEGCSDDGAMAGFVNTLTSCCSFQIQEQIEKSTPETEVESNNADESYRRRDDQANQSADNCRTNYMKTCVGRSFGCNKHLTFTISPCLSWNEK